MSALNSLIRVHGWALDEKRRKLVALENLADKLKKDLRCLKEELEREQDEASRSLEGTVAFPTFIAAALERRKRLRESIAKVERSVEAAREDVTQAFQETKKYELARDNNEQRERHERDRREQSELDELGLNAHRRRDPS
jgi:flagellar biosynthesis chaperone FliJ